MVFVLDKHKRPLMPCTPKKARLLLARGRAVVHRQQPFIIRLKDRTVEQSTLQPIALKIDPGSRTTGIALARVMETEEGQIHTALHLAEVCHRGEEVHEKMGKRASRRRRRRSVRLRYRPPRFRHRTCRKGWSAPSLTSRLNNIESLSCRYARFAPLSSIAVEHVKFDLMLIQNPEAAGLDYQRGTLAGWETRAYLLEKFQRRCAYCGKKSVQFEVDHLLPRSRGGTDRVSNLVLSCHAGNQAKGNQTATEFGHPEVEAQAKVPLKDAAVVNTLRYALVKQLGILGLPIGTWSGGRTRWNRARFGIQKTHALDALCVGDLAGVDAGKLKTLRIIATGRGRYCRTNFDGFGFPSGYLMRKKQVRGVKTGDRVRAVVPAGFAAHGIHVGRIVVRANMQFRMGNVQGIPARFCRVLQRADGYDYSVISTTNVRDIDGLQVRM